MGVVYNERLNQYKVFIPKPNRKYLQFCYKVDRYGEEFAKKLAEMSFRDERRYHDYFEIKEDIVIFKVFTKRFGIVDVVINKEDFDVVSQQKLSISNDNHAKTFYCKTRNGTGVHRVIMDPTDPSAIVDHIDRNGLNNRRDNLRIVTVSINNRNSTIRVDNATGTKGVTLEKGKRYKAEWYDNDRKKHSKSFSISKYGEEKALQMAVDFRKSVEEQFHYIGAQERSTTIETK